MDILNRPYRALVAPYKDRPDLLVYQDWYPANPDAKYYPGEHCFGSNLWAGDWFEGDLPGALGLFGKNNWAKAKPAAHGQYPCLTPDEALNGFTYDPDLICERRPDGLPLCCGLEIIPKGGGLLNGQGRSLLPKGGGYSSGRVRFLAAYGGGLASGVSVPGVTYGGGLASGVSVPGVTYGGAFGSGAAELEVIPFCAFSFGDTVCTNSILKTSPDCWGTLNSSPGSQWWLLFTPGDDTVQVTAFNLEAGQTVELYEGNNCSGLTLVATLTPASNVGVCVNATTSRARIRLVGGASVNYVTIQTVTIP